MSGPLYIEISALAAAHVRTAETWWGLNRPKAPGANRTEERASSLIALQPEIGTRARNLALPGVRRLHLGRIRYDLYYPSSRRHDDWKFWPSGMPAVAAFRQSDRSARRSFRRRLASREWTLGAARHRGEPVGHIAAPELEVGLTPFSYHSSSRRRLPSSLPLSF